MTRELICCLCGFDNPRSLDGWYPGVGGICWEHALALDLDELNLSPFTDDEVAILRLKLPK